MVFKMFSCAIYWSNANKYTYLYYVLLLQDSRDTDPGKLSSHSSKRSSSDSKKSQKVEDKERSFSKARDWVNGNYPSKEDLREVGVDEPAKESPVEKDQGQGKRADVGKPKNRKSGDQNELLEEYKQLPNRIEKDTDRKEKDRRMDDRIDEDIVSQEIKLSRRAAEIRQRFQDFANRPADSPTVDREINDYRYTAESNNRDIYDQKFGTPKKSSRSSPLDSVGSKKTSKSDTRNVDVPKSKDQARSAR